MCEIFVHSEHLFLFEKSFFYHLTDLLSEILIKNEFKCTFYSNILSIDVCTCPYVQIYESLIIVWGYLRSRTHLMHLTSVLQWIVCVRKIRRNSTFFCLSTPDGVCNMNILEFSMKFQHQMALTYRNPSIFNVFCH